MELCDRVTGRRHRRFWKCLETLPAHVLVGIGSGPQEKLARCIIVERLSYRPVVHCIGAALGFFIMGDQIAISDWADRFYLGWLLRFLAQPRLFAPRVPRKMSSILNGKLAPAVGFEPTTNRLTADRSTTELRWNVCFPRSNRAAYILPTQFVAASASLHAIVHRQSFLGFAFVPWIDILETRGGAAW